MLQLILSIFALFVGVALCAQIQKRPSWLSFFDAFVVVSIVGLVLFHIIPHTLEDSGLSGMAAIAVGFGIPAIMHRRTHRHEHGAHCDGSHEKNSRRKRSFAQNAMMIAVIAGMCAHTVLDGIGLSMSDMSGDIAPTGNLLGISVLFHRLPVGFFLSLMLAPRIGTKKTWGVAAVMALSTAIGFGLGHFALPHMGMTILYIVQGLIAGMLLHVVFHNVSVGGAREFRYAKGLGAFAGIAAFAFMTLIVPVHEHHHASPLDLWIGFFYDAAPIWAFFAAVLAICYGLRRAKNRALSDFGAHCCRYLDPQPRPVSAGGCMHLFGSVGFILIFTLFAHSFAATWWICAALAAAGADILLPVRAECAACGRIGHCDTEKSFAAWTMTSFGTIAGALLIASVLPFFAAPLAASSAHLSDAGANAVRSAFLAGFLGMNIVVARRHHGSHTDFIAYNLQIILLFAILCIFSFGELNFTRLMFASAAAICSLSWLAYAESPLTIPSVSPRPAKTYAKFSVCLTAAVALFCALALLPDSDRRASFVMAITPEAIAPIAESMHNHDEIGHNHDETARNHDETARNHDETARNHDEIGRNHDEIARNHDEIEHNHDKIARNHDEIGHNHDETARNHDEIGHNHDEISDIHGKIGHERLSPFHARSLREFLRAAVFWLFAATGLFWLLRVGPRDLFGAKSKHRHNDCFDD